MQYGLLAIIFGFSLDAILAKKQKAHLSTSEKEILESEESQTRPYPALILLILLTLLRPFSPVLNTLFILSAFGAALVFFVYPKFRRFINSKNQGINEKYTKLGFNRLALASLIGVVLLLEASHRL